MPPSIVLPNGLDGGIWYCSGETNRREEATLYLPLAQNKGILLANYCRRTPPSLSAHSMIYPLGKCGEWPRSFRIKHPGNISTVFLLNISSISISLSLYTETILNYLLNVYMFVYFGLLIFGALPRQFLKNLKNVSIMKRWTTVVM